MRESEGRRKLGEAGEEERKMEVKEAHGVGAER